MDRPAPSPDAPLFKIWEAAAFLAAVAGVALTLALNVAQVDLNAARGAFVEQVHVYEREAADRMAGVAAALTTLVALHHASDALHGHEFEALSDELLRAYPHLRSVARLQMVDAAGREALESASLEGRQARVAIVEPAEDGGLGPAGARSRHLPIVSFSPLDPALAGLIGLDVLAAPALAAAADAAIGNGAPVASDGFAFPYVGFGFLAFKAFYRGYGAPEGVEERRSQVGGAVAIFVEGRPFFDSIAHPFDSVRVSFPGAGEALFDVGTEAEDAGLSLLDPFRHTVDVGALGRVFRIEASRRPTLASLRLWPLALAVTAPIVVGAFAALALANHRRGQRRARDDQQRLRVSEERFRDFAASTADLFWEMDADLRFTYLSDRFEATSGVPPTALLGKTRQESGLPGCDPEAFRQHLDDLAHRRPFRNFVHPRIHADGRLVWVSINGRPVFDAEGSFVGYRGTGSDITEQANYERALADAKAEAEAANQAKSAFLATMSHELRTPLNAVVGFSEIMQSQLARMKEGEELHEFAGHIHTSGMHLLNLINDLLDLSKIESGKDELREGRLRVRDVAEASARMVSKRALDGGVRLVVDVADDVGEIMADRRKVLQILVNLLSNAVKFTRPGGEAALQVRLGADGGVAMAVRDTGIGIAAEDIPKAFAPFMQIDNALSREFEGTGLGLPLTRRLAEQHGGVLDLESREGVGTTVTVRLPPSRTMPKRAPARRAV